MKLSRNYFCEMKSFLKYEVSITNYSSRLDEVIETVKTLILLINQGVSRMKSLVILFCILIISPSVFSYDDSQRYKVAKFYKKKAQRAVDGSAKNLKGECRLMLSMNHLDQKYAKLKRVRTNGNSQVCKLAKKELKKYRNKKITYDTPEKLLRLTITTTGHN